MEGRKDERKVKRRKESWPRKAPAVLPAFSSYAVCAWPPPKEGTMEGKGTKVKEGRKIKEGRKVKEGRK